MAPPRKSVRLARELAEAQPAKLDKRFFNPFVFRHLCELTSEKMSCGDRDGLRLAGLCCRLAQRLETEEARATSFARLATALRLANRLDHAERALVIALAAAPTHFKGDLLRRRASIRIYQGRLQEAIKDSEAALDEATGQAKAKAHEVLGIAHLYNGDHPAGIRQLEQCMATTDPDAETAYCNALHNYATALGEGTDDQAAEALNLSAELRSKLKPRHKQQRAKLWWTEGLAHERLGDTQKAWWSLNTARRSLIALRAAPEVAAIVADMARVAPEPLAVQHICGEAATIIGTSHSLTEPLESLALAPQELIPDASTALREAANQLATCPAFG